MAPRKNNASQIPTTADETTPTKEKDGVNIEDLALPRTMVQRLAKGVLPPNTQIQKDAITAMSKSATVFVNYLSQAHVPLPQFIRIKPSANTSTIPTTRKTISPEAVLDALAELEFEDFLPRVQAELKRFNEVQTGKRNEYRRKLKEKEGTENGAGGARSGGGKVVEYGQGDGEERAAKRVRRGEVAEVVNSASSNSTDKSVASEEVEEVEEVEEEDEQEEETGKEDTVGEEEAGDGTEEEEDDEGEEDSSADEGSGEERATDQEEHDEPDLDEGAEDDDDSSDDSE
ncbi:hypothetical protein MMC29_006649 [Sticta canariensis]|nr:hypothetical protein [Sticta canariensis]